MSILCVPLSFLLFLLLPSRFSSEMVLQACLKDCTGGLHYLWGTAGWPGNLLSLAPSCETPMLQMVLAGQQTEYSARAQLHQKQGNAELQTLLLEHRHMWSLWDCRCHRSCRSQGSPALAFPPAYKGKICCTLCLPRMNGFRLAVKVRRSATCSGGFGVMLALVVALGECLKNSCRSHHPLIAFCKVTELPLMA